VQRQRLGILG